MQTDTPSGAGGLGAVDEISLPTSLRMVYGLPEVHRCAKVGGKRRDISFLIRFVEIRRPSTSTLLSLPSLLRFND